MNKEQAIEEINKAFEPSFANYIITALTEGATVSDKVSEPCEDAVSRQSVKEGMIKYGFNASDMTVTEFVEDMLPPATPAVCIAKVTFNKDDLQKLVNEKVKEIVVERKKGKWINKSQKSNCGIIFVASECTCCGMKTPFNCDDFIYRYCPNFGAEMEGEDDSN